DVRTDVDGAQGHEDPIDSLAATLHERLDEALGLLVTGDIVEADDGDPLVPELGCHVPAARRLLLVAAHGAPEDEGTRALGRALVGGRLSDDGGNSPLV